VVPALALLMVFTPSELINGILLRQANRGFDWYSKGSIILFFLSGIFYFYAFRKWSLKDERIQYILLWAILLFVPIVLQGRTSQHQLAYCAYPFAILAAKAFNDSHIDKKRHILLAVFITVNMSLAGFFIATAPTDLSYSVADIIEDLTDSEDMVISGNPLTTVLANRISPPNLTNVAEFHYPATTAEDIIYWLKQNTTKIIVLYFYLSELPEISSYLANQSEWQLHDRVQGKGQILFENLTPAFSNDTYLIYIR
jgi:4-amino-4-deoxy-L-arabinose transferase-like glycosyltransferase